MVIIVIQAFIALIKENLKIIMAFIANSIVKIEVRFNSENSIMDIAKVKVMEIEFMKALFNIKNFFVEIVLVQIISHIGLFKDVFPYFVMPFAESSFIFIFSIKVLSLL